MTKPLPFMPGDWVASPGSHERIAKVRSAYWHEGEILLDLWIYSRDGKRIGRESPALGGPRGYEPSCDASLWERISAPEFPVPLQWVVDGDGKQVAKFLAGGRLPPANWVPRPRKGRSSHKVDDALRRALEEIAEGHNDPRALARKVLGKS